MTQPELSDSVDPSEILAETVMDFDQGREWLRTILIEQCRADYNTASHLIDWLLPYPLFDLHQIAADVLITDKGILTLVGLNSSLRIRQSRSLVTEQTGLAMVIRSLKELVQAFISYELLQPNQDLLMATRYGMTASDFMNPALYWSQLVESFEKRATYADDMKRMLELSDDIRVESWQKPSKNTFYPYPLVTHCTLVLNSDESSTPLPTVNWRVHSEWMPNQNRSQEVLTVSQIQTPQQSATDIELPKINEESMRGSLRRVMTFAQTHPRSWRYLFPQVPPLPTSVKNLEAWEGVVAVVAWGTNRPELMANFRDRSFIIQHLCDDLQLSQQQAEEIFSEYLSIYFACRELLGRLGEPRKAREARGLQFKLFTKLDRAISEPWHLSANQLAEAYGQTRFPVAKYLSLLLLVSWMRRRGLSVLRFPTVLPYQLHGEGQDNQAEELDRRIISHLQLVFEQLVKDVDGIRWQVEPNQDGYAELEIGSGLSSPHDWINSVLHDK